MGKKKPNLTNNKTNFHFELQYKIKANLLILDYYIAKIPSFYEN